MTESAEVMAKPVYRPSHMRRDGDCVVLNIPMTFRRRNGRREIILPRNADGTAAPQPERNRALVLALARAWRWQEMLDRGEVGSVDELARRLRLGSTYVARVLKFTSLAPDLGEAILAGKEPDGLSLRRLSAGLPYNWREQRQFLDRR